MRNIFFVLLVLFPATIWAQTGNYFLANYAPGNTQFDNDCFAIAQDNRGVLYYANRDGVLQFDGQDWELIKSAGPVYSLFVKNDGQIMWGGVNGFGTIQHSRQGIPRLSTISKEGVNGIFKIEETENGIYFLSEESIYHFVNDGIIEIEASGLSGSFTNLFEVFGQLHVSTSSSGVYRVEKDQLEKVRFEFEGSDQVLFSVKNENQYIIATDDSRVYRCTQDLRLTEIELEDKAYAEASVIMNGSWVHNNLIALATLRGGIVFFNPTNGKTEEIINYTAGLPDNEVFSIFTDKNQNVWTSHDYGFTKISPQLPFRSFSHYPGLEGNLLCAITFNNQVYIGTSLGLYKLSKEDAYEEIVYYVDVEVRKQVPLTAPQQSNKKDEPTAQVSQPEEVPAETSKKKKGFLSFLKRNKNKGNEQVNDESEVAAESSPAVTMEEPAPPGMRTVVSYKKEKRVERVVRASQYLYSKVNGITAKITSLQQASGRLIAAGLGGVFEVEGLEATSILEEPVRFIYPFSNDNIFAFTYADEARSFHLNEEKWQPSAMMRDLNDEINFVFQGAGDELWLCGLDQIYRLNIVSGEVKNIQTNKIPNPNFDKTVGVYWRNEVVVVNREGFFKFDRSKGIFNKIDSLGHPTSYKANPGQLLFHDGHMWNLFGEKNTNNNLKFFNLITDLRFLSFDQTQKDLWVITGSNELFKLFVDQEITKKEDFPIHLKSITYAGDSINTTGTFRIEEDKGALTFRMAKPNFLGGQTEFRYQIEGLNEEWSDWSVQHHQIDFPYLPAGKYSLLVESRDFLGKVESLKPLKFVILPPYWKQPWFYAMEFSILCIFVYFSLKLSVRYRVISRLLTLLAIILLIELIQTIAGNSFGTDERMFTNLALKIVIAIIILPVEGYLRDMMFRNIESSHKMYNLLRTPKQNKGIPEEDRKFG